MDDEARYHALCERLRACWTDRGERFSHPPATEAQVRASEERLGFSLPPLLRLLYREVANGGNGLVWHDEEFPLVGVQGGCRLPWLRSWQPGATIESFVSHSGWRPHPVVLEALSHHRRRYVYCDQVPDQFVTVSIVSFADVALDPLSGRLYLIEVEGNLPLDDNQTARILSIQLYKPSLEDWLEEWLGFQGCGVKKAHDVSSHQPRAELTSDLLDAPAIADSPLVWRGLYRGVGDALNPEEPVDSDGPLTD